MKVLITGADGFIGSNVLQYLLNNTDWEFTVICSFRHMGNPLNIPLSNRVEVVTLDLRGQIPALGHFDYILHFASESHVDRSITDPVPFIENNIAITLQILEYARRNMPERFILFSTDEVYGAHMHADWDVLLPTNPYAASKASQEMIAVAYYNTYKIPIIITNSNNIVGPNQHPEKFIPKIIGLIKAGKTVPIHVVNGKMGRRYYNPVQNTASAIKHILGLKYLNEEHDKPPRYSLAGGKSMDNLEMAKLVAEILGKQLRYRTMEVNTVRPAYDQYYDESTEDKLSDTGWTPPISLKQGLRWIQ